MKVADNQYLYRLETQNENGASIDYVDIETIEPLRSVQDIHDEIDLENNKQIKRIEEIVFTGDSDEYWYNDDTHTTDTHFVAYIEGTNLFCNVDHPYCETDRAVFEFGDVHIDENKNFFCTSVELNGMNRIYISIDKSLLAYTVYSHETLKEYFKENPSIKISAIITNKKNAYIVERAKKLGIPYCYFNRNQFYSGNDVLSYLKENKIDYIILAGFLWLVPQNLLEAYPNKIINIHPAILPNYGGKGMYGMYVHEAVIENKEKESKKTGRIRGRR